MDFGQNLIFLISQPRSGSSLLQHILGGHPEVGTLPEPWFMLHFAYGMRESGIEAEYNAKFSQVALSGFLNRLSNKTDAYIDAIRASTNYLYARASEVTGREIFLDKTPRYYYIIPELYEIYPEAKFVFLIRNPLAVLSSILGVNLNNDWFRLFEVSRFNDIFLAPYKILEGIDLVKGQKTVVHYEELVSCPENTVHSLCTDLGLKFHSGMLNYGDKVHFKNESFVDPKSLYKHREPVKDYVDDWKTSLTSPQSLYIAQKYLEELGPEFVQNWGYSYDQLMDVLKSKSKPTYLSVIPWKKLKKTTGTLYWYPLRFLSSLESKGLKTTFTKSFYYFSKRSSKSYM